MYRGSEKLIFFIFWCLLLFDDEKLLGNDWAHWICISWDGFIEAAG